MCPNCIRFLPGLIGNLAPASQAPLRGLQERVRDAGQGLFFGARVPRPPASPAPRRAALPPKLRGAARSAPGSGPGFAACPPAAALAELEAGAAEAAAVGAWGPHRARAPAASEAPCAPTPRGRNPLAAAPPGAARDPDPARPAPGGDYFLCPCPLLSPRRGGTFLALPARLRLFPLLPRRVFSAPVKIVPHK